MAVWGIGAIEQHSAHLPLATDWLGAEDVARRVAAELGAYLVPTLPYSLSQCHGTMPGTVWLRPETLAAVLRDVVQSLCAQGLWQVLLINGHGGNFVLEAEVQRLNLGSPAPGAKGVRQPVVLLSPLWRTPPGEPPLWPQAGIHADESETAHQLAINARNVRAERADCTPAVGREFLDYVTMGALSPCGAWGRPSAGSAAQAEEALRHSVPAIAAWARDTFARVAALRAGRQEG
jgi:creatinine amidohydrolase